MQDVKRLQGFETVSSLCEILLVACGTSGQRVPVTAGPSVLGGGYVDVMASLPPHVSMITVKAPSDSPSLFPVIVKATNGPRYVVGCRRQVGVAHPSSRLLTSTPAQIRAALTLLSQATSSAVEAGATLDWNQCKAVLLLPSYPTPLTCNDCVVVGQVPAEARHQSGFGHDHPHHHEVG